MATASELQSLKDSWRHDPIWDIEDTEGFEQHYDELKKYREEWEQIWKSNRDEELLKKAKTMGIPDNLDLVRYIEGLEYKIERLEKNFNPTH